MSYYETLLKATTATGVDPSEALIRTAYRISDEISEAHEKEFACEASCASCCRTLARAVPAESRIIAKWMVDSMPPQVVDDIRRGLMAARRLITLASEAGRDIDGDWATSGRTCPFTTMRRTCAIYPVRPLSCRQTHSTNQKTCDVAAVARMDRAMTPKIPVVTEAQAKYQELSEAVDKVRMNIVTKRTALSQKWEDNLLVASVLKEIDRARLRK